MAHLTQPSSENVSTTFEYFASQPVSKVSLVGSWDEWSKKHPMLKQPDTNVWLVQLSLLPGPVTFKFVTDDEWVTTSSYDVVEDGFGGENNHRTISVSPENKHLQGEGEINPASDQTSEGGQEELEHEFEDEKPKKEEDAVCTIC